MNYHIKRYTLIISLLILSFFEVLGQDVPSYSHFYLNPYVINPAYAGLEGRPFVSLTHRRQWLGIEDAPITSNITIHSPIVGGFNMGLNITQDNFGIFKNSGGLLSFGYSIPLGFNQYLSFGLSGGAKMQNIDFTNVNLNDPALIDVLQGNTTKLDGNAGLAYHIAGFNLGFSIQNIFNTQTYPTESFDQGELGLIRNFIVTADYMIYFGNDDFIFQPYGQYKSFEGYDTQFEAGGIFHLKHVLWVGGSYRQDFGIIGLLGLNIKESFALAYAYEMPATKATGINKSSHEINLSLAFGKKKDRAKNYQTFVASSKPIRPKKEKKPKKEAPVPVDTIAVTEEIIEEVPGVSQTLDSLNQGGNKIRLIIENSPPEEPEKEVEVIPTPITEVVPEPITEVVPEAEIKPAVITKKGNHPFEIATGHYVVVGAFGSINNAIRMNDKLTSDGYESDFGFSSEKGLFYVFITGANSAGEARKKRDEIRKLPAYQNAWYLLVE